MRPHLSGHGAPGVLIGRQEERAATLAFVRASGSDAPSYLWWHARARVGKTALLADCVTRPPPNTDVLNFFVVEARRTDTRTAFVAETAAQIRAFLRRSRAAAPDPSDAQAWADLLGAAAAKSARHGRKLLLVVDGLDEDPAWAPQGRTDGESIAALLPARPDVNVRIVVSSRGVARLPDDLPAGHPLRLRECLRELRPREHIMENDQVPRAEADRLRASDLGRAVTNLLAVTGGGLSLVDLAELAGAPVDEVNGLLWSADGRCVVSSEPVTDPTAETYALSHPDLLRSVRQELGDTGVARQTGLLRTWAGHWRAAGWPDGTPPYLLTDYLRLLDDADARTEYVLDARRQVRLASVVGHDVALAQMDALGPEQGEGGGNPERLGHALRFAASRASILREARQVPYRASVLYVRLGDPARARALAHSASNPLVRAARLARVAAELSRTGSEGAAATAHEAVDWLARASRGRTRPPEEADAYTEIAEAAQELHTRGETGTARALLRAVVLSGAADVETLIAAVNALGEEDEPSWPDAVEARADELSTGGPKALAAAVDILATIAGTFPARAPDARNRINAICADVDSSYGLMAVDILALGASALKSRKREAPPLVTRALDHLTAALTAPEALSAADRAHLRREVSTTLVRLHQAVVDNRIDRDSLVRIEELVAEHRERLRTGVLGDDLAERMAVDNALARERRAAEEAAFRVMAEEDRKATRRWKDADRRASDAEAEKIKREWEEKKDQARGELRRQERAGRTADSSDWADTTRRTNSAKRPGTPKPLRRRPRHCDLPKTRDDQSDDGIELPRHVILLRQAERLLADGNLVLGRERLEEALRRSPLAAGQVARDDGWTLALAQALGVVGESPVADRLLSSLPGPESRPRHLAAVSLGCSQGGHDTAAGAYAKEAARLGGDLHDPALRGAIAQALAHAGEATAAVEMAERKDPEDAGPRGRREQQWAQTSRSLTAVAAGLARRAPDTAAGLVVRQAESTGGRHPLIRSAELLLGFPDVRQPGPEWCEAMRQVLDEFAKEPRQQWHAPSLAVLDLLVRLGCCTAPHTLTDATAYLRNTLSPDQLPYAELAVLDAVAGDVAEARRLAGAAPDPTVRVGALAAVATYLAGVPVALSVDPSSRDAAVRVCLALAHATGDGTAPDETAARALVAELVAGGNWPYAIALLPRLAPEALEPLAELAGAHSLFAAGVGGQGIWMGAQVRA
ncbi:hypothetical protein [Streptomyces sp. NPDC008139]|uniref:hypothetical protein n=1 Tax=Streptomyces sp. NPDC008139 TaxID=3364814 RepID=UPI0036EEC88E